MRITQRTGIGRSLKNRPPFGKFSDLRVTTGPRRFSKNWGSGGIGLSHMGNCSNITRVSGVANKHPWKVYEVPAGRYFNWQWVVTSKPSEEDHKFTRYLFFLSGSPSFVRQLWGGGINRYRTEVLMYVGSRVRNLRGRQRYWRLKNHHRLRGVTTAAVWVGLREDFGKPSLEAILRYGVPSTLDTIWDTTSKLKTGE